MEKEDITLPLVQVSGSDKGSEPDDSPWLQRAWNLNMFSLQVAMQLSGKRKENPVADINCLIQCLLRSLQHNDDEELRRLFYVALTRAEQHWLFLTANSKMMVKNWSLPCSLQKYWMSMSFSPEQVIIANEVLSEFTALHFGEAEAPEIEKMEEEFISRLLDKFVMNVTALNNYLKCPLEFYFKNLIRIPSSQK